MRILLVEDDRRVVETIRDGLDPNAFAIGWAAGVGQALRCLASRTYDIMVLDLGLPDGNGLSIAEQLRSAGSELPILVLTANNTLADRMEGFRHGVDDYLSKPFAVQELCARLHAILRRYQAGKRHILSYQDIKLDLVGRKVRRRDLEVTLSAREMELLAFFCSTPSRCWTGIGFWRKSGATKRRRTATC